MKKRKLFLILSIVLVATAAASVAIHNYRRSREYFIRSGAAVQVQRQVYNEGVIDSFFEKEEHPENDTITVVVYSMEGDPIIYTVTVRNHKFEVAADFSRDRFGGGAKKSVNTYENKAKIEDENGTSYYFFDSGDDLSMRMPVFLIPPGAK